MKLHWMMVLVSVLSSPLIAEEPLWKMMTPSERIQYVNTLTDRIKGSNAADTVEKLRDKGFDSLDPVLASQLSKPLQDMIVLNEWKPEERQAIRAWLQDNRRQLDLVKKIATKKRLYMPLSLNDARWVSLDQRWEDIPLAATARLLAGASAQEAAQRDDWRSAYDWNIRQHNIADLLLQQPGYPQVLGLEVEQLACEQLLDFLYQNPPNSVVRVWRKVSRLNDTHCPMDVLWDYDQLVAWDAINAWHEWDKEPSRMLEWSEELNRILETTEGMRDIFGIQYDSENDFRRALRKTSVEKDWKQYEKIAKLNEAWWAKPSWEALPTAEEHSNKILEMQSEIPAFGLYGRMMGNQRSLRINKTRVEAYRAGLETVTALIDYAIDEGQFPKTLEQLVPKRMNAVPIDPFSGKPLVYSPSPLGKNFVLYSVGANLRNDNAKVSKSLLDESGDLVFWPRAE